MKYKLAYTTSFRRAYRQIVKRGYDVTRLRAVVDTLQRGEKPDARYRDHALTGEFVGYRECHIRPDWLLVYKKDNDKLILTLIDTGTHADLFGL